MLIVTRPFASYQRGDAITDAAAVASVTSGPYRNHVVSVQSAPAVVTPAAAPAAPAPAVNTPQAAAAAFERAVDASEAALHAHPAA